MDEIEDEEMNQGVVWGGLFILNSLLSLCFKEYYVALVTGIIGIAMVLAFWNWKLK